MLYVENEYLSFGFDLSDGVGLVSLVDKTIDHEYLPAPRPASRTIIFKLRARQGQGEWTLYASRFDFKVTDAALSPDGSQLHVTGRGESIPLRFTLTCTLEAGQGVALWELGLHNEAEAPLEVQLEYPTVRGLQTPGDPEATMGAVPIELGTVGPLSRRSVIGFDTPDPQVGVPHALNAMQVATLYDPTGLGGLFFADLDGGVAPIQLALLRDQVSGRWATILEPGATATLPRLAIGAYAGDWHQALDYYVSQRQARWQFPEIPAWLREAGAIYNYGAEGGGGIYQMLPTITLKERIDAFANLPQLLTEAQQLGTNVVYLFDYWEGATEGPWPPYWNKGDYIPRADMGGPEAFKAGIAAIHEQGGRVILYVEPFIVYHYSDLGQRMGERWAGRNRDGSPQSQYPDNYTMCATFDLWQAYITEVAQHLVQEYGADGIYLDSFGWQWNWWCFTPETNVLASPSEWNQGVLDFIDRVRSAIREINPEAVVMTESHNELLAQHVDGALDATFAWLYDLNGGQLLASPVRYALPEANIYSAGRNLNQLNQVFAAGHSLALAPHWLPDADYIRRLVEIRHDYRDALVYGWQAYQPDTGSDVVGACFYEGAQTQIITVVNIAKRPYEGALTLRASEAGAQWRDLLTGDTFSTGSDQGPADLPLAVPPESLRILVRES
ncbi:MAG: DUF6259 domain-containing protein [Anaerolineae bacterium]|nr:DUF6259 domain-containing protein [Anaerolineae bacterium]